jgi:hypothetical protein
LRHSKGWEYAVARCNDIYIFCLHWLTWDLIGALMFTFSWMLLLFFILWCFLRMLQIGAAKSRSEMIDRMLYISRRACSLLTPVLSLAGSVCTVIALLHDCSLWNLLGAVNHPSCNCNCSRLGYSLSSVSLGTHECDVRPNTTAARRLPAVHSGVAKTLKTLAL